MGPKGMFIVLALLIMGWLLALSSSGTGETEDDRTSEDPSPTPDPSDDVWPVVAESTNETDLYPLESLLESNNIPALVETESLNSVKGAMTALRNRLRVQPDHRSEAVSLLKEHNQGKFLVDGLS